MKKMLSRVLCVIMALVMLAAMMLPAFAQTVHEQVPVINVPGFMATDIYSDRSDPESDKVWPPKTETILEAVAKGIPYLSAYLIDGDADKLCDNLNPLVNKIFEPALLNPDGTAKGNEGVLDFYPEPDKVSKDGEYSFRYDWRTDPMEIAAQLNDFVNYICEKSGCSKVSVESHSLGGLITTTYIAMYGDAKLKNVVMNSTAVFGESFNGELLNGHIRLSGDALVKYMKFAFEGSRYEDLLNKIFALLQNAGILDAVCHAGNDLVDKISYRVVPESVAPLFAGWLTIWAMIPDEYLPGAMDYIFNEVYKDDTTHDLLKEKIERYNTQIRVRKAEVLQQTNEHTNLFVIARYGYSAIPVTPAYNRMTDCSIDLTYASYGAVCADYGQTLTEEQMAGTDAKYISPDKVVNASTCLFPEQTWFIKNLSHSNEVEDFRLLVNTLLQADEQYTVDTLQGFSRFMTVDGERLVPTVAEESTPEAQLSLIDKIKRFFNGIFYSFLEPILRVFKGAC